MRRLYTFKLKCKIMDVLEQYICQICGFSDPRALVFDHINSQNRLIHRRYIRANQQYYEKLLKNFDYIKSNLQVLCHNCNWIKRYERGEYN